jgi:hypothetical protein
MDKKKLTTIMLIGAAGLLLTWWGLQTGASQAAPAGPPATPIPPEVDDVVDRTPQSSQVSVQRAQTVTLDPLLTDVMEDKWPVRVDDIIYNKPGDTAIKLPADACDNVTWGLASGVVTKECDVTDTYIRLPQTPDPQPWVTVTYQTRTRAVRYRDLITVTSGASTNPPNLPYDPFTVTIIYDRQFPQGRMDYWGHTFPILRDSSPSPTDKSDQERWVRWIATAYGLTGTVVVSEPLFGSDLTITHFLMSPAAPKFGDTAHFTAVIKNTGVMTAWRWFAAELYLKSADAPPPQDAFDHAGGWDTYGPSALFSGWEQPTLGPGQAETATASITITLPGNFRAYAQVDTAYNDPGHYAWWGSNPEGYGIPPYPEEQNVVAAQPFTVQGFVIYLPNISK